MRTDGSTNEATSNGRPMPTRATVSLRTAVAMVGSAVGIFFMGVYAANAVVPGTRGGHTRTALTVAGTLTGLSANTLPHLTFTFSKMGAPPCVVPVEAQNVRYTAVSGAFNAEVDIERCAPTLFDGADTTVMVEVRDGSAMGTVLVTAPATAINPVPYARYADHYGTPDCPVGYERVTDAVFFTPESDRRLCQKSRMDGAMRVVYDEVVRVGTGASAFWIDRYEASVWRSRDATRGVLDSPTTPFGAGVGADYPRVFSVNGSGPISEQFFAVSRAEVRPSANLTWFQASEACAASGKRLPTGDEWLRAARNAQDVVQCQLDAVGPRPTGAAGPCVSGWGVQDMIGNLSEWTAEWYAGPAIPGPVYNDAGQVVDAALVVDVEIERAPWPEGADMYSLDTTINVASASITADGGASQGAPSGATRGGNYRSGPRGGRHHLDLAGAPSYASSRIGFRCVIPR